MACAPYFVFTIDGHNMTIIETDGVNTQPLLVDTIPIYAGQRYSFILDASQPVSNYWIRGNPNLGPIAGNFTNGVNSAILRYVGASDSEPTTSTTTVIIPMQETDLHPLEDAGAPGSPEPGGADVVFNLNLGLDPATLNYSINGVVFVPPTAPVLLQILSGAQTAQDLLPPGSVYTLPPNKVIELSIPGGAPGGPVSNRFI